MLFDMGATSAAQPLPPREQLAKEFNDLLRHTRRAPGSAPAGIATRADDHGGGLDLGESPRTAAKGKAATSPAAERKLTAANLLQLKRAPRFRRLRTSAQRLRGFIDAINTFPVTELRQ